jgi:tetrahydromethanopterin S-methyltransferase subunit G
MIDGRIFDGVVGALLIVGTLIGIVVGALLFIVIPWLYQHIQIGWTQ